MKSSLHFRMDYETSRGLRTVIAVAFAMSMAAFGLIVGMIISIKAGNHDLATSLLYSFFIAWILQTVSAVVAAQKFAQWIDVQDLHD